MVPSDSHRRQRRSIQLRYWNYANSGAYFVTICTYQRACLFGGISDGVMVTNPLGEIAQESWAAIPQHFSGVELDSFVIMPNHVHGILVIDDVAHSIAGATRAHVGAQHAAPLPSAPLPSSTLPKPGSLGAIVRSFKSAVTKRVNVMRDTAGAPVWQRNYYEHIVRSERELNAIRQYIANNPANWQLDADNPANSTRSPQRTADD